jgi:hypothetical protein
VTENLKACLISFICLIAASPIAEAKNYAIKSGYYISIYRSIATIVQEDGRLLLSVSSRPVQGRGSSVGADCELRAAYNSNNKKWELIPFSNETMNISMQDISKVSFYVEIYGNSVIKVDTDFALRNCAIGTLFDRSFRLFRKQQIGNWNYGRHF